MAGIWKQTPGGRSAAGSATAACVADTLCRVAAWTLEGDGTLCAARPSTTAGLHRGASVYASGLGGRVVDGACARPTSGARHPVRVADPRRGARADGGPPGR